MLFLLSTSLFEFQLEKNLIFQINLYYPDCSMRYSHKADEDQGAQKHISEILSVHFLQNFDVGIFLR